jgi:hypothetical protein
MAAFDFIPEIWSKRIIVSLKKNLVAASVCNREYEGDVGQAGDTVKLWKSGTITVGTYTKNTNISTAQVPDPTEDNFTVNQQKYFHFYVDRIDIKQGAINPVDSYMDEAIYAVRDTIDQYVIAKRTDFASANQYTPTTTLSSSTVYNEFAHMQRLLTDSKVPLEGRWAVISPRVLEIINQYLAAKNTSLGDDVALNGYLGKFAGFAVYLSHNITDVSEDVAGTASNEVVHYCLFGHSSGITLVVQIPIDALTSYEPELRFGRAIKGLTVYGAKVLDSGVRCGYMKAWWTS